MAGNIIAGGGTSTINLNGGTLIAANAIGTLTSPLTTFSITNSTLQISAAADATNVSVTTLNVSGAANVIKISSAPTNDYQFTIPLISYVNYNGPTNFVPDFTALSNAYPGLSFTGSITTNDNMVVLNLTVHRPPTANADTFNRTAGLTLKIKISDLLANDIDADGNALTLAGINLVTTNGVNLQTNETYIYYTSSLNADDQFSYTITDGYGSATGLVSIVVVPNVTGQVTGNITVTGSSATVNFAGIPNYPYGVQRSTIWWIGQRFGRRTRPAADCFNIPTTSATWEERYRLRPITGWVGHLILERKHIK
ncbi:MAG: Ig-like domain-containing protein [Limisphaerales bacterium]